MKRLVLGLFVLLAFGWGLSGTATAAPKGTLTIGIPTDINTLDPHMGPEVNSLNVAYSTMEALLRLDAQGNIKPQLAESWEVVDNTTYVFRLRKNVKFSNGEPFNGKAVEYSWKRSQEKHRANKTNWATVSRIEHLDDHTIRIVTEKPDPVFLKKMAGVSAAIFPPKATAEGGDEAAPEADRDRALHPVVLGEGRAHHLQGQSELLPARRAEGRDARVARDSRGGGPRGGAPDGPDRHRAPDPAQPGAGFSSGTEPKVSSALSTRTYYIAFNNMTTGKGTPIMDARVRRAMNHGMDLQAIIESVFNGQAQRVNSLIGNVQFGYDSTLPPMAYDVAKAKQLLAEAGVPNGFKVGMACPSGAYTNDKEACQAIAGSLAKIGIEVDLQIMESNRFWDLEAKKQLPPLFFDGVGDRLQDPSTQLGVATRPRN